MLHVFFGPLPLPKCCCSRSPARDIRLGRLRDAVRGGNNGQGAAAAAAPRVLVSS